ncbi:hypothetical protein D6D20_05711 [Aureobasidium pullulans]|uniref:BTB domain-containing protein n=1 Tax=Aureobasidium pullulans TaxID=5580 RepID=A0A4V4IN27_AURPU|nr:hypothetical protein D6D20_05711 [Aureobasidium pullulans]
MSLLASDTSTPTLPRIPSKAVSVLSKKPACFGGVVTIEVGAEKKAFVIHKDLLSYYSDYFRAVFNGSFKESVVRKLCLVHEDVDVFDIFNAFVYTNQLRDKNGVIGKDLSTFMLVRLWLFGEQHLVPALQNAAADALMERMAEYDKSPFSIMTHIYALTIDGSPLRRLVIDSQVHRAACNKDHLAKWPQEALVDLAMAFSDRTPTSRRALLDEEVSYRKTCTGGKSQEFDHNLWFHPRPTA